MYDDEMLDAMFYETLDFDDDEVMQEWAEYFRGDYDDDVPTDMWYEDDDALQMGFDPYLGCYTDDC